MKQYGLALFLALQGCAAVGEKADRYHQAAQEFLNAPNIRICYSRRDGQISGVEFRCFGQECELPECPK